MIVYYTGLVAMLLWLLVRFYVKRDGTRAIFERNCIVYRPTTVVATLLFIAVLWPVFLVFSIGGAIKHGR